MQFIDAVRALHIAAGSVALATFAIPLLTRKGAITHRRFGWSFVIAISIVAATALIAAIYRLTTDAPATVQRDSIFLGYLSVLAASSARMGLRVLRFKTRTGRHTQRIDFIFSAIILAGGVTLFVWGIRIKYSLDIAFGLIGVFDTVTQLLYWSRQKVAPLHWKYEHMLTMMRAAVAAITAFVVINARTLGVPPSLRVLTWIGPAIIFVPLIYAWIALLKTKDTAARI